VRLVLPLVAIVALGAVIVAASGWGGLWLYGFGVVSALLFVVLIARGGPVVEEWGRRSARGSRS
jgi:hypothetical protein